MLCRHHEQKPASIDAWLRRKGQPEKQHDEEVSDRAHGAQQQFEGLADDRAAAGGDRACTWQIARRRGTGSGWGLRRIGRSCRLAADLEITRVDAVLFEERLYVDNLGFDGVAQYRR